MALESWLKPVCKSRSAAAAAAAAEAAEAAAGTDSGEHRTCAHNPMASGWPAVNPWFVQLRQVPEPVDYISRGAPQYVELVLHDQPGSAAAYGQQQHCVTQKTLAR